MSLLSLKRNLTVRNLAANGTNDSDSKWYDDEDAVNDVSAFVHVAAGWRALRRASGCRRCHVYSPQALEQCCSAAPVDAQAGCGFPRTPSSAQLESQPAHGHTHVRQLDAEGSLFYHLTGARARTRSHAALHRMCRGHLCLTNTHTALAGIEQRAGMGHQRSRLLNPDFPVAQAVTCVSTVLLVYVAIVVQVEVGFFWHEHLCAVENTALNRYAMLQCAVPALVVLSSVVTHWCPFAVRPCY